MDKIERKINAIIHRHLSIDTIVGYVLTTSDISRIVYDIEKELKKAELRGKIEGLRLSKYQPYVRLLEYIEQAQSELDKMEGNK